MSYHDIAVKHGTDKAGHGYMPYYEKILNRDFFYPESAISFKLLEIGCEKGNSLRMWKEIFPKSRLFTIDLFEEFAEPEDIGCTFLKGSQTDSEILYLARYEGPYDLIIDDGSHNSRDQLISFYGLIGCCTIYVVEDLHCCNEVLYRQGMSFGQTMLGQMKADKFPFPFELYDDKIAFIYV
jgi:demethylmacrocin O-methyltransferase